MISDSLVRWPKGLDLEFPITPVVDASMDDSVARELAESPGVSGTVVEALMWLRIGRFEPAHGIVQNATRGLEAYVHGMLHRMEGDYGNANYWFRQARDPAWRIRNREFFGSRSVSLPWPGGFDPEKFTHACESWHANGDTAGEWTEKDLRGIALLEWEAVWENALNSLF